ncbi:MAG: MBL fold metallo-hydrolase, partial [Ginsengibacter sp.]
LPAGRFTIQHPQLTLIPAIKKDDVLIAEMDEALDDLTHCNIWWLGQSGFLLQCNGKRVLLDPYLSDSLTIKYANTSKPHVRMSERVLDPGLLRNISVVSSSHNHTDHLDGESLVIIIKNNPGLSFIVPEANRKFVAERIGYDDEFMTGLNEGGAVTIHDIKFHGIPAMHNEIEKDEKGNCKYMGYVIEFGGFTIYHSGDTLWFPEMIDLLKPFQVDIAMLPINGNDSLRGVAGNLDYREAAQLAEAINAKCVIPCHYDMFTFNTAAVSEFANEAEKIKQPYKILQGGGRLTVPIKRKERE